MILAAHEWELQEIVSKKSSFRKQAAEKTNRVHRNLYELITVVTQAVTSIRTKNDE